MKDKIIYRWPIQVYSVRVTLSSVFEQKLLSIKKQELQLVAFLISEYDIITKNQLPWLFQMRVSLSRAQCLPGVLRQMLQAERTLHHLAQVRVHCTWQKSRNQVHDSNRVRMSFLVSSKRNELSWYTPGISQGVQYFCANPKRSLLVTGSDHIRAQKMILGERNQ